MNILYRYRDYLSTYSITTQKTYYECVKLYLEYLNEIYGAVNWLVICNVTKSDIYNYIAYMDKLQKNSKKVRLYAIKNFYKYLKIDYLFEDIKLYGSSKKVPRILSLSQCRLLLDYYKDKRNKLIIYLFLTTGIRLSELANIRVEDIEGNKIKIRCKGGVERYVTITNKCISMIDSYKTSGKLFDIGKEDIRYIVKKAMRDLGINGSAHTLRHSFATIMYQETHDIRLVQELLGHKSIVSTQIYTHVSNNAVRHAVDNNPLANYGGKYES